MLFSHLDSDFEYYIKRRCNRECCRRSICIESCPMKSQETEFRTSGKRWDMERFCYSSDRLRQLEVQTGDENGKFNIVASLHVRQAD